MSTYFANKTGRALHDDELALVQRLSARLDELHPAQVRPEHTFAVSEGNSVFIPIIPHRALDGVSLAIWLDTHHAECFWAQVRGLSCCHDDLDFGYRVASVKRGKNLEWISTLEAQLVAELRRTIRVRICSGQQSHDQSIFEYSVLARPGSFKMIGSTQSTRPAFPPTNVEPLEIETSLVTASDLPFEFPPQVDRWL